MATEYAGEEWRADHFDGNAWLEFCYPDGKHAQGVGCTISYAPKVGERFKIDQNGIRYLSDESLHVSEWVIFDVHHEVCLSRLQTGEHPAEGTEEKSTPPMICLRLKIRPAD